MPLPKLRLEVDEANYSGSFGSPFHYVALEGGRGRRRRKFLGNTYQVTVAFTLDPFQYDYWQAFYRRSIGEGTFPFLIDLILETADPVEYQAAIIPESVQLGGVQGNARLMTMDLEVMPNVEVAALSDSTLLLYELYGDDGPLMLARLAQFVNVDAPEALN